MEEGMKIFQRAERDLRGENYYRHSHRSAGSSWSPEVVDVIQLPAFLARQTDLDRSDGKNGAVINVKKPQFMSPGQVGNIVEKFAECGNEQVILCERGACQAVTIT
ncbi:hypothetical protein ACT691_03035 [Vibrio metschnikovii]